MSVGSALHVCLADLKVIDVNLDSVCSSFNITVK